MDKWAMVDVALGSAIGALTVMMITSFSDSKLIDECEAELPRTQHCEIIKTAEVAK